MFDENKKLINDEELDKVAGGQDDLSFLFPEQIVHCPECGKEITIHGDHCGMGVFMTCPHCNKGITFQF